MNASQKFENSWLKRLHADADAIDAGVAVAEKLIAIDCAWIGFQGDFAISIDRKCGGDPREELTDAVWVKCRRRAAAEENALYRPTLPIIGVSEIFKLAQQGAGIDLFGDFLDHVGVEVTVGAFANAVRDMDVERKGR